MTISTQDSKVNYQGNGQTTVFQIPFPFLENEQIYVQKKDAEGNLINYTYGTDYTVTGAGEENGGSVTLNVAPEQGSTISIYRDVPLTQEVDYRENEIFPAETHEEALDKLTMEVQQIQEQLDRSVKVDRFSDVDPDIIVKEIERVYDSTDNIDIVANNINDVNTVADNIAVVNTVAGDIDSVVTTATDIEDVKTVSQNKASLNITAANIADVNTVAKDITSVKTTAESIEDVKTNATNITDINTNAANIGSINQVADIRNNVTLVALNNKKVTTVAENIDNVNVVANNITNVVRTGASIDNVNTVAGDIANVNTVAGAITDVDQVAMIKDEVKKVGDNIGDVMTVASIDEQVTTVANNANAVKEIGDNIDVVLKSPTYANNAKTWSEGTDTEVGSLGGTHSAKGWAEIAAQVSQINPADETTAGIIRIATMEEAEAGVADTAAITPLKAKAIADEYTGKVVQLGFNGTLTGDTLTFVPDQEAYTIKTGFEYEVDLLFPAAGVLPDATKMVITNGEDTINIVNVKDADASSAMTYGNMKQMCRYDAEVGWRWIFNARYAITDTGVKVLVMPSAVIEDSRYVTTDTAQNITAGKNFVNNATSTTTDAHTGMSICLKNSQSDITANTQNADGSVDFKYQGIRFVDKNNEETGFIYNAPDGVGGSFTRVGTSAKVDGQYVDSFIEMEVDANGKGHVYLPTVDEDATVSGNQAATVDYVKNNYVTTNTEQTISATKTLESNVAFKYKLPIDRDAAPEAKQIYDFVDFVDVNGNLIGDLRFKKETNGQVSLVLGTRNNTEWRSIEIVNTGGTGSYISIPSPPDDATSSEAITAHWAIKNLTYVSLPTSANFVSLTIGASGANYTAPEDGWFAAYAGGGQSNSCQLINNLTRIGIVSPGVTGFSDAMAFVPARKGETVKFKYTGTLIAGTAWLAFYRGGTNNGAAGN